MLLLKLCEDKMKQIDIAQLFGSKYKHDSLYYS